MPTQRGTSQHHDGVRPIHLRVRYRAGHCHDLPRRPRRWIGIVCARASEPQTSPLGICIVRAGELSPTVQVRPFWSSSCAWLYELGNWSPTRNSAERTVFHAGRKISAALQAWRRRSRSSLQRLGLPWQSATQSAEHRLAIAYFKALLLGVQGSGSRLPVGL